MLVLRNITRNNNIIAADYYPENRESSGHIKVSILNKNIVLLEKAKGYEYSSAPAHAKKALLDMIDIDELPAEVTVMWY